jgi:lipoyl(octanoyl) transferase
VINARNSLQNLTHALQNNPPVEWRVSQGLTPYEDAIAFMEARVEQIANGAAPECVWLVEHPPLITAGTSAKADDLLGTPFPVYQTGRGGQYTYHGPGQRVAYVMLDLKRREPDVRKFVAALEAWIIATLKALSVVGEQREDRVGVWVARTDKQQGAEDKIAAIGIRVRKWVTFHGISLNVNPDLSHFSAIIPCGVKEQLYGVTSLADLGLDVNMRDVDVVLRREFEVVFGITNKN